MRGEGAGAAGEGAAAVPKRERGWRGSLLRGVGGLLLTYFGCCVVCHGRSRESRRPSIIHANSTSIILCKEEEGDDGEERRKGVGGGRKEGSE